MQHRWNFTLIILILSLASGIAGCGGKPPSQTALQAQGLTPAPGKALVYFYNRIMFIGGASISLDEVTSQAKRNSYVLWEVDSGKHTLKFLYAMGVKDTAELKIDCKEGHVYFFRLVQPGDKDELRIDPVSDRKGRSQIKKLELVNLFQADMMAAATAQESQPSQKEQPAPAQPAETPVKEQPAPQAEPQIKEAPVQDGRYYAVVIGIDRYQQLEPLTTAVNDARMTAILLQEDYGFQVQALFDQEATREGILDAFNALQTTLTAADKVLIYYAGRCSLDYGTDKAYWLPVNAERDSDAQWILVDAITAYLKQMPARQILIVADSCYSGTLTRLSKFDFTDVQKRQLYLDQVANKRSRVVLMSGGTQPLPETEGTRYSIFGRAFAEALRTIPYSVFSAEELLVGYILEPVAGLSEQIPEFKIIRNSGHQGGDFIFTKCPK